MQLACRSYLTAGVFDSSFFFPLSVSSLEYFTHFRPLFAAGSTRRRGTLGFGGVPCRLASAPKAELWILWGGFRACLSRGFSLKEGKCF